MIASEKKDAKMVEILLHKLPPKLLDQTDSNGKTACHYACDNTLDDQDLTKEVVKVFLEFQKSISVAKHFLEIKEGPSPYSESLSAIENRQIDLFAKDKTGQTPFDYLPSELKTEFASQYPEIFSEVWFHIFKFKSMS